MIFDLDEDLPITDRKVLAQSFFDDRILGTVKKWTEIFQFEYSPNLGQKLKNTSSPIFFIFFPVIHLSLAFTTVPMLAIFLELLQIKKQKLPVKPQIWKFYFIVFEHFCTKPLEFSGKI
jgi:hypothetical protein